MPSLNRYGGVTYLLYNPRPRRCRLLKSTLDNTEAHLISPPPVSNFLLNKFFYEKFNS